MIPTMAPGTWHTAIGQSIPLPLDFGRPLSEVAPMSMAAAAGVVAGVAIAVVLREALHAGTHAAEDLNAVTPVRRAPVAPFSQISSADSIPAAPPRLRPFSRVLGFVLMAIGTAFGLGAVVAQLAHALPLHELARHPRLASAAVPMLGGLALIAFGSFGRRVPRRDRTTTTPVRIAVAAQQIDGPTWLDAA